MPSSLPHWAAIGPAAIGAVRLLDVRTGRDRKQLPSLFIACSLQLAGGESECTLDKGSLLCEMGW